MYNKIDVFCFHIIQKKPDTYPAITMPYRLVLRSHAVFIVYIYPDNTLYIQLLPYILI